MRQPIIFFLVFLFLPGCATSGSSIKNVEKKSEWTMQEVGKGIQLGSVAGSAGAFAPLLFGVGFLVEKIGDTTKTGKTTEEFNMAPETEADPHFAE